MRPSRTFPSDALRLTAWLGVLLFGLALVLSAAVLYIVNDTQTSALVRADDADIETLANGYRDEGLDEAVEIIKQRLGPPDPARSLPPGAWILIEDAKLGRVHGNLDAFEPRLGVFEIEVRGRRVLGRGTYLAPGVYIFVGRDTAEIVATRDRIVRAFGWVFAGSLLFAALGAALLRVQLMRRVDAITRTCEGIMEGRFEERIALRGRGDELERLSIAINDMLNRISALLENLRQVSSDVAHDLRTPLARLRNRLEDARAGAVTGADYAAAVSRAIEDTDHVLAIFAALLRISQIEAGTRAAAFAPLSLSAVLAGLVEMYRPVAEDAGHRLISQIQPEVWIRGDAELLTQLYSNLIENAINHTPAETTVRVILRSTGDSAEAMVRDDGPGIPQAEFPKVTRRFYRLSGSREAAGHGLGLALVSAIAHLHHATLELTDAAPGLCVSTNFN